MFQLAYFTRIMLYYVSKAFFDREDVSYETISLSHAPTQLSEVVGQKHLVGPGQIIDRMITAKMLSSMILYGPPGTGKTSIASAIAGTTKYAFRMAKCRD